jgi:hypothetical protein
VGGANGEELHEVCGVTCCQINSRGGTRTRDPGIMSAVL